MGAAWVGLTLAALATGSLHIRAELRGPRWQTYVCKPLTTTLLLVLAATLPTAGESPYRALVVAGLVFSLAGDVFLMLPSDRFLPGLVSFFVAHVLYIAAFAGTAGFGAFPLALLPVAAVALLLLCHLWPHLGDLRWAVLGYVAVIATMGWQALSQWLAADATWALQAFAGAALFLASDSALAIDRFRSAFAGAPIVILGTYYAAQCLIALSVSH